MADQEQLTESEIQAEMTAETTFEVLHPENVLMIRFQRVLKEKSSKRLKELQDYISEKERAIKKIKEDINNLSEIIYDQKSESSQLETQMHNHNELISRLIEEKHGLRKEIINLKNSCNSLQTSFRVISKTNSELRRKLELQRHCLQELKKFEANQLSMLLMKHNAKEKNKIDKKEKLKTINKQDFILMKLENYVFNNQILINDHKYQLEEKCSELKILLEKVKLKNSEFENNMFENQRLIKLWKNVVQLVSRRDDKYSQLKSSVGNIDVLYKSKIAELQSFKKSAEGEMIRNEVLTRDKNNKQLLLSKLKQVYCALKKKAEFLENDTCESHNMVELTRKNVQNVVKSQVEYKRTLVSLEIKLRNQHSKKYDMEENVLVRLHNEVISSQASSKFNDDIRKLQKETSDHETIVNQLQNIFCKENVSYEKLLHCFTLESDLLRNMKKEINLLSADVIRFEENFKQIQLQIKNQNHTLEFEKKQLKSLEVQPIQDSILLNNWAIMQEKHREINQRIETEKRNWIRKQNKTTLMIEQKTQYTSTINSEEKHMYILQQKFNRLSNNIQIAEKERTNLEKSISCLLRKTFKLNNLYGNQKECYYSLDNETCTAQNTVLEKLKSSEENTISLLCDIGDLNEKKSLLDKDLFNVQKSYLEWEKKLKLAHEMRESILKKQSDEGEIGSLKNEIHRMEIRYSQLKKAQESLTNDLESCVLKRDRIFDSVTNEKNSQNFPTKLKMLIRQTENFKNKNKELKKRIEDLEAEQSHLCNEKQQFVAKLKESEKTVEFLQDSERKLDEKLLEYMFVKQKNLEIIIRGQRLADFLYQFKNKKAKPDCLNEITVERNCVKNRSMQFDLIYVLEMICKEFPDLMSRLIRNINTLKSITV